MDGPGLESSRAQGALGRTSRRDLRSRSTFSGGTRAPRGRVEAADPGAQINAEFGRPAFSSYSAARE